MIPERKTKSKMTRAAVIFAILLMATVSSTSRGLDPEAEAPDFALQDTDGTQFSLTSMRGKIVIVVFWRAEQERSIEVLTTLQSIYAKFKDDGVEVLALSNDEGGAETASKMRESKQLTFHMLLDAQQKAYGAYEVFLTPSTFIIDKEGKLDYYYPGYRDDFQRQISGRVEILLGRKTLEELQAELKPAERPEISESEKKAGRYLKAGNRLLEKGMAKSAMLQYQKAVKEDPGLFEVHLRLGDIYLGQEKVEEADVAFRRVIELKPRSADAHAGLGDVLFFQGQLEKSVEMLQIALKLNPKLARAHYRLGRVHEEQGQIEDALKEYKTALRILLKTKD